MANQGFPSTRPGGRRATGPKKVAPGVARLAITGSNVYFIRSGQRWALIDTAWDNSGPRIRDAAARLFGPVAPAAIILTHLHPDHSGAVADLARAWRCPVYLHPDEIDLAVNRDLPTIERYANPLDHRLILPLLRLLPEAQRAEMLAAGSLEGIVRPLDPAAPPPGLPDWRCIPTPGHTPGHIALFRERDRVVITGDAVLTVDTNSLWGLLAWALRLRGPHVYPPPRYTNWNQQRTDESFMALAALQPRILATGHGASLRGEAAARALRALAVRCDA